MIYVHFELGRRLEMNFIRFYGILGRIFMNRKFLRESTTRRSSGDGRLFLNDSRPNISSKNYFGVKVEL